ncbi:MAG: hypothetical protein ACJAU1_000441 [Psychromonas sp.]
MPQYDYCCTCKVTVAMLRQLILLLIVSCHSYCSYANEVFLYSPPELSKNPLSIQLKSSFKERGRAVADIKDIIPGSIVVGLGQHFLAQRLTGPNTYLAVLPYIGSNIPEKATYHQYYHVSPDVVARFLSKQFTNVKIGFIYYDENDPFLTLSNNNHYDGVRFIGRRATKDLFSAARRLRERDKVDLFLVTNDTRVYTGKALRFLLEDMYRQNLPVMSLSAQLVHAGAAFALVPNVKDFTTQTVAIAQKLTRKKDIPYVQFAETYEVVINEGLLKRFGITLSRVDRNEE